MKKIAFYIKGIYNGGTEIALLNLITVLDKSLYDIYVVSGDFEEINENLLNRISKFAKVIELQKMKIDVLIFCSYPREGMEKVLSKIICQKSYFWFHYFSPNQLAFLEKVNKEKLVDNVIVVCETIKRKLLQLDVYKNCPNNIISIYNILLLEDIYNKSKENITLELSDSLNLITVARLCKPKGFHRMKYLAECLIEQNVDFKWHILGCACNQEEDKEINDIINCYPGKVIMHGYQDNPYKYISKCDYLVLLSDEENMPYVVVEAKALGVPCILTNFDSAYEQITDMQNGIILDRSDLESYKNKIPYILENKEKFKNETKKYKYSNDDSIAKWNKILS